MADDLVAGFTPAGGFPERELVPEPELDRRALRDDVGNAERFVVDHQERLRHVEAFHPSWLVWDGRRWAPDETSAHVELAKLTADALWLERQQDPDPEWRKHAAATRRAGRVRAMLELGRTDPRIARRGVDFDHDPWLLNVENGTVDLHTGELRPHDPADNLTKLAGAAYRSDAEAPTWERFLREIFGDDTLAGFVRRLAGYAAIGSVREHVLPIFLGVGANGKSTMLGALHVALGDYAHAAPISLLVGAQRPGAATPELADLRGRRLVTVAETREDGTLAVERVKALTGGDPINARHLHANPFTFTPSHTPILVTNHRPRIDDDGDAIWRRLLLVPFDVQIPKADQDRSLGESLALEADGILAWIVRGATEYAASGLEPPERVLAATAEYRDAESTFRDWIHERLELDRNAWTASAELARCYLAWARDNGVEELSQRVIGERLGHVAGIRQHKGTGGRRGWRGVRIRERSE